MKNEELKKPYIDRITKISIDVMIDDTKGNLVKKTVNFTNLPGVSIESNSEDSLLNHTEDILNNRSYTVFNGHTFEFERALVDVEEDEDWMHGATSISTNEYKMAGRNLVVDFIDLSTETVKVKLNNAKCPHCGESHYMVNDSYSTSVYYPPIYKDGVNINPDQNITTTHCTCMNCGGDFSYSD